MSYHHKMLAVLVFLALSSAVSSAPLQPAADGAVTVRTDAGLLRGHAATSIWNRTYYSFQAVPYAQPPVGELRFKSPRQVKPWTGTRDATKQGPYCPQGIMNYTTAKMSEDCLYLNVYVPQVAPSHQPKAGLSVLVWIHGGGFVAGSGIRDLYGPDNLMNHTAILVTLNYRLGVLGYMSMEHREMTSNAGMKDQVAALRWVRRNIAQFGGNPDDVTVFGESAGGMSVELLLLTSMTAGLFHRAISESGSAVTIGTNANYNGTQAAFQLAEVLGHNASSADDVVKFLRSVSVEDVLKAQTLASSHTTGITLSTFPTIDAKIQEGSEVFLADVPEKIIRAGKSMPIPYISGVNSKEMKMMETGLTQASLDNYNNNPELLIPSGLNIKQGTNESLELGAKIKSFYFGNKSISYSTLSQLVDVLTDNFMIYSVHRSSMLHINYGSSPFYSYLFTYDGTLRIQLGNYTVKGPGHADDMAYLFFISYVPYSPNHDDIEVIHHFTNMWVDFATSGNPSMHESVKWTPATKANHTYLQIDVDLSLRTDMLKERMAFWDQVYETHGK
ncbi:juvenile hormone esterase-like [Bacillus rossius redtenbacheri]|uniref:juvenile hormone esterase-like n=1 Tax=Bacillus rossius redtenbacheri TaxID=93214 RepID=UPI002FDE8A43